LNKKLDNTEIISNDIYDALDTLSESDKLSNIEKKVIAKKKLVDHLTTKKEISESKDSTLVPNETLLNAVLANNFNVLYTNTLSESQKEELKNILSIPYEELLTKTSELKESVLSKVDSLLIESNDNELKNKLDSVKKEVNGMSPSKYNYYRLTELKNGLN
jgi:rRNA-processing protein FCF1